MKVVLYFKDFRLGELTRFNGNYVYNSNPSGEEKAKNYPSMLFYNLYNSHNLVSYTLFPVFQELVDKIKRRKDILDKIGMYDYSHDFNILCGYGKLSQMDFGFNIKTEDVDN